VLADASDAPHRLMGAPRETIDLQGG